MKRVYNRNIGAGSGRKSALADALLARFNTL